MTYLEYIHVGPVRFGSGKNCDGTNTFASGRMMPTMPAHVQNLKPCNAKIFEILAKKRLDVNGKEIYPGLMNQLFLFRKASKNGLFYPFRVSTRHLVSFMFSNSAGFKFLWHISYGFCSYE